MYKSGRDVKIRLIEKKVPKNYKNRRENFPHSR